MNRNRHMIGVVFKGYDEPELIREGACLAHMTNRNRQKRGRVEDIC